MSNLNVPRDPRDRTTSADTVMDGPREMEDGGVKPIVTDQAMLHGQADVFNPESHAPADGRPRGGSAVTIDAAPFHRANENLPSPSALTPQASFARRASKFPFVERGPEAFGYDPEALRKVAVTDWSPAIGNPSPFGLYAFSVTAILFGFINIGIQPNAGFIMLAMNWALVHGGIAQVVAGAFELWRGQTFAGTTFTTFGFFWIGLGLFYIEIIVGIVPAALVAESKWVFFISFLTWGSIAAGIFVVTTKHSLALMGIFGFAALSFIFTAVGHWSNVCTILSGVFSIALGVVGIYTGTAVLINETWGRLVLPIGLIGKHAKHH
ncbi:GPR1/FUN34/yaaH family-domain-containing protein [Hyaloraphidium curvatum]|nr:GPR1/FUN34/yaaH family-domain-containing protein [Hyaloraphidium curvatum]